MAAKRDHLKVINQKKGIPRWKRTISFFFKLVLVCALLLLLKYGETFFRISDIAVEGAQDIPVEAILAAGDLKEGMSILLLSEGAIASAIISSYPEIKEVKIKRNLPDSLVVVIKERSLAAYVLTPDGYWLIDRDAVCFAKTTEPSADYPLIKGIDASLLELGQELACASRRETLRSFLELWPAYELLEIEELDFIDSYNLIVRTSEHWEIWLGDGKEMAYKLKLVQESIPYIETNSYAKLDVRSGRRLVVSGSNQIKDGGVEP